MNIKPNTRVLVTAGASGIGLAIAKAFTQHDARVHICDISESHIAEAAKELPGASFSVVDVAEPEQVDQLFDEITRTYKGLDVLINNAGIAGPTAKVEDITPDQWERTLAVNINGQFHCVRRAVPLLKEAGGGSIINLSSVAGRLGFPLRTPYSASKWAVIGFTRSLAMELGSHGICVNAILPGVVSGQRFQDIVSEKAKALGIGFEEMKEQYLNDTSLKQHVTADEIASMTLFLCSDQGTKISGQSISVCGNTEVLK